MLETQRIPIILFPPLAKRQGGLSFKDFVAASASGQPRLKLRDERPTPQAELEPMSLLSETSDRQTPAEYQT